MLKSILCSTVIALFALPQTGHAEDAYPESPKDAEVLRGCMENEADDRSCINLIVDACADDDSPMNELRDCTGRETAAWDVILNEAYRSVRGTLREQDSESLDDLTLASDMREAQRKWIAWRDAKCGMEYQRFRTGTLGRDFYASCMQSMTAERAIELLDWESDLNM